MFAAARAAPAATKRAFAHAEGEEAGAARRADGAEDGLARPILIGRPPWTRRIAKRPGLRPRLGKDFERVNPGDDPASASTGKPPPPDGSPMA